MKNIRLIFILLLYISVTGCSPETGSNIFEINFTANVNGQDFTGEGVANIAAGGLSITGVNPNGSIIVLSVVSFDASQSSYDLAASATVAGATYFESGDTNSFNSLSEGGTGLLTITEYDQENNLISGAFNFTALRESLDEETGVITSESVVVRTGEFTDLEVSGLLETVIDTDNTLTATVDGEAFTPNSIQALEVSILGQTSIFVTALNTSTGQNLSLNFPEEIMTGTFELEDLSTGDNYTASYNPDINNEAITNAPIFNGGSTITIDTYDEATGLLEGSFEFTAGDILGLDPTTFEITEGTFSVTVL